MIDGFELLDEIGRGGFGVVHRARDLALDRVVAIKVLTVAVAGEDELRRFDREAQLLGRLSEHPHVVTILQTGRTDDGRPWVAMTWLPDGSFADLVRHAGPMSPENVADVGVRIAGALATAHRAGILHLDVKPENILRTRYGSPELADFGIAQLVDATRTTHAVTASLAHAAPEVIDGAQPTAATDVYGLASTLHHLLAGRPAFRGASTSQLVAAVLTRPPPDLGELGVPRPLADVVAAGMAKKPSDRIPTAEAFAERLRQVQSATGIAPTEVIVLSPVVTRPDPDPHTDTNETRVHGPSVGRRTTHPIDDASSTAGRTPTRPLDRRTARRLPVVLGLLFALALAATVGFAALRESSSDPTTTTPTAADTAVPTGSPTGEPVAVTSDGTACDVLAAPASNTDVEHVRIDVALDAAEPGDVVCLAHGDYTAILRPTRGGVAGSPVVLASADGAAPVLRGGLLITGDVSHLTVRGLVIERDTEPTVRIFGDSIVFEENEVTGSGTCMYVGDALQGTAENTIIRRNHLHDCGPTTGLAAGISLGSTQTATIVDNLVERVARRGIVLYPDSNNTVVEHNTLVDVGTPLDVGGIAEDQRSEGMSARNNVLVGSPAQAVRTTYENGVSATGHNNVVADNCIWPASAVIDDALTASGNRWVEPTIDDDGVVTAGCVGAGVRPQ